MQRVDHAITVSEQKPGLPEQLEQLAGRGLSRRELGACIGRLLAETLAIQAVAILGYDRRRQRLMLLAERGLPAEARAALDGKSQRAWDIPLRGLRNRRISVIEAAHQNPFVPASIVSLSPTGLSIASLPVYYDYQPAGVVLLFATGTATFGDNDLHEISLALRVCARGLRESYSAREPQERAAPGEENGELLAAEGGAAVEGVRRGPLRPGARPAERLDDTERLELIRARQQLDSLQATVSQIESELARARAEIEQKTQTAQTLSASRQALARERDALAARVAEFEREQQGSVAALRQQVSNFEDRVLAAESERVRHQRAADAARATAQALERERAELLERLHAAESGAAGLQAGVDTLRADRERLAAEADTLLRQLQGALAFIEDARAQVSHELAALSSDRDTWRDQAQDWQARAASEAEVRHRLDHELSVAAALRDAAQQQLDPLREEAARLAGVNEDLARTVAQAEAARAASAAEITALRRSLDQERAGHTQAEQTWNADLAAARADTERLSATLAARTTALAERDRALAESVAQLAALRREHEALGGAVEQARRATADREAEIRRLAAELAAAENERQRLTRERAEAQDQLAQVVALRNQTEEALATEIRQARDELVQLESARAALQAERTAMQARLAATEARLAQAEAERADIGQRLQHGVGALDQQLAALTAERAALLNRVGQIEGGAAAEKERAAREANRANALADQIGHEQQTAREATAKLAQLGSELGIARARIADIESQQAAFDSERARLEDSLAAALARVERAEAERSAAAQRREDGAGELDRQLAAVSAERAALLDRVTQLEGATAAESQRAEREARRASGLTERLARLQEAARDAATRQAQSTGELAQARSEIEALRQQSEDRGAIARQAAELNGKVIELDRLLAAAREETRTFRAQLAQAEQQRATLAKGVQAAHREHAQQTAALAEEQEKARAAANQLAEERQRFGVERTRQGEALEAARIAHASAVAELQSRLEKIEAEHARLGAERDRQAAELLDERQAAARRLADTQSMVQRLAEREQLIGELEAAARQRETAFQEAEAERQRLDDIVRAATGALAELRRECRDVKGELDTTNRRLDQERTAHAEVVVALDHARKAATGGEAEPPMRTEPVAAAPPKPAHREAPLVIERSAPLGAGAAQAPGPAASTGLPAAATEAIALLDEGALSADACAMLRQAGIQATPHPIDNAADVLARQKVSCVLLNLASGPNAWHTLKSLRERVGTRDVPILAYLMNPDAPTGFSFGRADFALWPLDAGRLIERVVQLRPKLRRLLVVSHDVEGMGRMREPLARARISASFVLDGRQARDLAASIQPEAAVLHLSPGCTDVARTVASLRSAEASHLPLLILLDKVAPAREEMFLKTTIRELLRAGTFDFGQLATELARVQG